ncbi:unnamed protein product [Blepharisma stoltei]|uniref:Uncharacterized protein n=1 Tax=Blepharisma stoltei TaxID=1481888 RepID=A0AAU9KEW6_9CILI|nr:unnamed protein product [Blepharisma stoltei]
MEQNDAVKVQINKKPTNSSSTGSITKLIKFLNLNENFAMRASPLKSSRILSNPKLHRTLNEKVFALPSLRSIVKHRLCDSTCPNSTVVFNKISSLSDFGKINKPNIKQNQKPVENKAHTAKVRPIHQFSNKIKRPKRRFNPKLCIYGSTKPINANEITCTDQDDISSPPSTYRSDMKILKLKNLSHDFETRPIFDMVTYRSTEYTQKVSTAKKTKKIKNRLVSNSEVKVMLRDKKTEYDYEGLQGWGDNSSLSKSR